MRPLPWPAGEQRRTALRLASPGSRQSCTRPLSGSSHSRRRTMNRHVPGVIALAVALTLTACGGTSDADTDADPTESADADFPRTVQHAMGETEIPARPERVVVLDTGELDSVLSLGVVPVGAVTTDVASGFLSYLAEGAADVEQVGTIGEPNLEAIAALQPDLILSNQVRHAEIYDELSQIAPTVFAEKVGAAWKDNFGLAAEALGLEDEGADALTEYETAAAELGEAIGDPA